MSESLKWIKSTYSAQGNCTEVADQGGHVLIRDSKQSGTGPMLSVNSDAWRRFADQVKRR
jgi:hypothetical protein